MIQRQFYENLEQVFDCFPKYNMKILLDFNEKLRRENIFKPTIGNEVLHQVNNENGVRIVKFATSKHLIVTSTKFPHRTIHKYTCTSLDGQTHNQFNHIDSRRRTSIMLDVRSFTGAICHTDHYLVVSKVRKILAVNEQAAQRFVGERFTLRKLNELEDRRHCQIKISNRLAALEKLIARI